MIKDWIQLLHIPEFYEIAFTLFTNVPIDDDRWVAKFSNNGRLTVQSPLGINSHYNRLIRVRESLKHLDLEKYLSDDASRFLPSHMYMRGARRIGRADDSVYYGFGSIVFIWVDEEESAGDLPIIIPQGPENYEFPWLIEAKHIGINFAASGEPHHGRPTDKMKNWSRVPALKASYVVCSWNDERGQPNRSNGPHMIAFRNYREFWLQGEFKRATWDGNGFSWPHGFMGKSTTEAEVEDFVKRSKGVNPRNNQFFKEERDEFNYMTEFMIDG